MKNKILKTVGFMAMATVLAKFLGLVRDSLIASNFAIGDAADAFMAASKLPTTLFDMVIGGVISASFIPVFTKIRAERGEADARGFANRFITMIILVAILISALGILLSDQLVTLLAPAFTGDKHVLTAQLSSIMFPMIIFTGIAFSCVGLLQSFGEYNIPSIISLVSNAAIILYFFTFSNKFGVKGLAVTMVIAWSLQVLIQVPSLIKFKFSYRPSLNLFNADIKRVLLLAGPMLVATWVQPLYSIINARLASGIDGAVSGLEYANRLYIMVTGVFSFVITNLIFPKLAKANAEGKSDEARALAVASVKSIALVILPVMAMFLILARPITSIIYQRNNFDETAVVLVSSALRFYAVGMIGLAMNEVLSKVFFSVGDSRTPMVNSIISMVINIALAYMLFSMLKTQGLALAAACGSIINALLNLFAIKRRFRGMFDKGVAIEVLKSVVSASICAVVTYALYMLLEGHFSGGFINNLLLCIICGSAGLIGYALVLFITRHEYVRNIVGSKNEER